VADGETPAPSSSGTATANLAHELAHAVTHDACTGMTRDVCEVVAESVAHAVCSRFGLDLSLRSVDYVAGWLDDPEAFHVGMAAIHSGAASLIDAIETAMTDAGELKLGALRGERRRHAAGAFLWRTKCVLRNLPGALSWRPCWPGLTLPIGDVS
jgi:hypothetical protein